jgi:DNA primase
MAGVMLPPDVKEVVVAADNDRAGVEAAEALAHRVIFEGRKVWLAVPSSPGDDWLDVLNRESSGVKGVSHVA